MSKSEAKNRFKEPIIEIFDLKKYYRQNGQEDIPVLKGIDFNVFPGEMVSVMGPSGSGKSTLLFILGLFLSPSSGVYRFSGRDVLLFNRKDQAEFRRRRIGFVFQSTDLLEHSTVYENLEFPLIYAEEKLRARPKRITEALAKVNLSHRINHPANLLSGGERQRVAVARALVNQPQIILADEPTGQLDKDNSQVVMDHFASIVSNDDTSVILVTHDQQVAERCSRIMVMEDGLLSEK